MSENKNNKENENKIEYMPIFMCLGVSVGMTIGVVLDNISVGMCLGCGIGVAIGAFLDTINKKSDDNTKIDEQDKQ